jgi:hypothetical protein
MTAEQFTYWLQGFMEVANPTTLDATQTQIIKDHLALVFDKQTPDRATGLFDPTINVPTKDRPYVPYNPHNPPSPMTGRPIWEIDPNIFRPVCETKTFTSLGDNENVTVRRFC